MCVRERGEVKGQRKVVRRAHKCKREGKVVHSRRREKAKEERKVRTVYSVLCCDSSYMINQQITTITMS